MIPFYSFFATRIRCIWFGFTLPYKAAILILTNRNLLIWSLLPIVLTTVLYIFGISALQDWAIGLLQNTIGKWGISPESWSAWTLLLMGKMIIWVVAALTFTFASSIVASPFNDLLAEKSEKFAFPPLPPVTNKSFKQQVKLIIIDLIKTIAAAAAAIVAMIMSWIPALNIVSFVVAFLLITFQYISYPQTRRGIGLRKGSKFLWDHIFACAGFGAILTFLFAIPFLASFVLPLAVVGGTLLFAKSPGLDDQTALK